jgi:hypothetical protein
VDTRGDYHLYSIRIHHNGPGSADDRADYYYDGVLLFSDVTGFASSSMVVYWGPQSSLTSIARYEYVAFVVPEPSALATVAVMLLTPSGAWRRHSSRARTY